MLARHYTTGGTRPPFFPLRWIRSIDGYTLFRRDRPHNHRGGLLVYVNPNLRPLRRPDLEHTDIECITLELHAHSFGTFFLFFCYCPPNFPPLSFFPLLSERLEQATNFPTFLLGDFNAKHPLWNTGPSNTAGTHFRNVLLEHGMTQCVATPTRFSDDMTSSSTLDLLATNRPDIVENVVVPDPISDHCCVTADLRLATPNSKRTVLYRPDYERTDWPALCSRLNSLPLLESIQGTQNIEAAWQVWHNRPPSESPDVFFNTLSSLLDAASKESSHMLRDVTHTFRSENRVQDCAVRPAARATLKSIWHVGTAILHAESGQDRSRPRPSRLRRSGRGRCGPALLLVQDCLCLTWHFWEISTQSTALGIPKQLLPGPDCFSCYSTSVSRSA